MAVILAQFRRPLDAAVRDRFARRHHGELREAVDHVRLFGREMIVRVEARDLGAVAEAQIRRSVGR